MHARQKIIFGLVFVLMIAAQKTTFVFTLAFKRRLKNSWSAPIGNYASQIMLHAAFLRLAFTLKFFHKKQLIKKTDVKFTFIAVVILM
jgi:hypothetical protein